jgi:Protein of unknown function (DUF3309)
LIPVDVLSDEYSRRAPHRTTRLTVKPTICLRGSVSDGIIFFMNLILLIVLILIVVALLPAWPYSAGWGYYPSGGLGLVLLIVIILLLMGRL